MTFVKPTNMSSQTHNRLPEEKAKNKIKVQDGEEEGVGDSIFDYYDSGDLWDPGVGEDEDPAANFNLTFVEFYTRLWDIYRAADQTEAVEALIDLGRKHTVINVKSMAAGALSAHW